MWALMPTRRLHVRDGWPGSHELPIDAFYGRASVMDVTGLTDEVQIEAVNAAVGEGNIERLLLKTGCTIGSGSFPESWPTLSGGLCARAAWPRTSTPWSGCAVG